MAEVVEAKQVGVPIPNGGVPIFGVGEDLHHLNKGPDGAFAEFETVSGEGTGFQDAIRCRIAGELPEKAWYTQVSTQSKIDLKEGDTVLISFWARTIATKAEDGMGDFLLFFGVPAAKDTPEGEVVKETFMERQKVGKAWKQFLLPRRVPADYPAGSTRMNLDFGYARQTIDFAGIQVHRFTGKKPADLPTTE